MRGSAGAVRQYGAAVQQCGVVVWCGGVTWCGEVVQCDDPMWQCGDAAPRHRSLHMEEIGPFR